MILVGPRGAEQGQDAIAEGLGNVALLMVYRLHHEPDHGVDQTLGIFRVEVLDQRCRARHVGKERGDRLASADRRAPSFQSRLFG